MLDEPVAALRDLVRDSARSSKKVNVLVHAGCDGLAAGAILASAFSQAGAQVRVRAVRRAGPESVEGPVAVLADLGAGMASELDSRLGESWAVLDHHPVPAEEMDSPRVANPYREGADGSEVCAGGIAHMAAAALDAGGAAWAAVVAALGDGHDSGEGRALAGADGRIAAEAARDGAVRAGQGLLLSGRESEPVAAALARTADPFMDGVTWDEAACAQLVRGAGIKEREGSRLRTPADLSEDEQSALAGAVEKRAGVAPHTGAAYALPSEDPRGPLRDARDFARLLSACGRRAPGAAVALCMGQRGGVLKEARRALADHAARVRGHVDELRGQRWRTDDRGPCRVVNGDGVVPEEMTGAVCSLLCGPARGRVVLLRSQDGGQLKVSARRGGAGPDLHELMDGAARACGGEGGGSAGSAAARIPKDRLDDFLGYLEGHVKVQGAGPAG